MNEAYSAIGGIFERLNKCDYAAWANYIKSILVAVRSGGIGVDFGCGNGYFTRFLHRQGYQMTGVDISEEMLTSAISKARAEKIPCEFLLGDIAKLKLRQKADFITAINDCLNYISPDKIPATFKNIHGNLISGGLFIFDISTEYKLKNLIANNLFSEDTDDYTYIWFNKQLPDHVQMDLTLFKRAFNGTYSRSDEQHIQYFHSIEDIKTAAENAGFSVRIEGHLGAELPDKNTEIEKQRINFILRKL